MPSIKDVVDEAAIRRRDEELGRMTIHWAPAAVRAALDRSDLLALLDEERAEALEREESMVQTFASTYNIPVETLRNVLGRHNIS